ncbi:hypothetical protein [Streptomyces sp. NPDC047525]|uniref:hypothetical protein n=1 Tax=Streptomyces sp. NPDC047525 TaxID=3155264 RepID=UPI0033D8C1B4
MPDPAPRKPCATPGGRPVTRGASPLADDHQGGAKRKGMSEAEIIRQGIRLAAMANRDWDEPLFSRTFEGTGRTPSKAEVRETVADAVRCETDSGSGPCREA